MTNVCCVNHRALSDQEKYRFCREQTDCTSGSLIKTCMMFSDVILPHVPLKVGQPSSLISIISGHFIWLDDCICSKLRSKDSYSCMKLLLIILICITLFIQWYLWKLETIVISIWISKSGNFIYNLRYW